MTRFVFQCIDVSTFERLRMPNGPFGDEKSPLAALRLSSSRNFRARCGQLGHWKDDNERPVKVNVVNWEETEEEVTDQPHPFLVTTCFSTRERTVCTHKWCDRCCMRSHFGWNSLV